MRFLDQSVIVTGGARGIGAEYAKAFADEGAVVTIADVLKTEGEMLAKEINGTKNHKALFVQTDVTSEESVARMTQHTAEVFGTINILVNNAAVYMDLSNKKPFDQVTTDEWDKVMAVNARGVWQCSKAVLPYMRREGRGKIVNMTSTTVHLGIPGFAHYVASKAAVIGLTRALARELGSENVTVNAVAPGLIANEASEHINPREYMEHSIESRAIQRAMSPTDLVGLMLFLASSQSDFISGQTLIVDGGAVMS
ncbi:MAG: SDR family oxidoreductase [Actinomycetota bacterium]|nr:SDR family oxidoreductase [Actinomycetota bacterium]